MRRSACPRTRSGRRLQAIHGHGERVEAHAERALAHDGAERRRGRTEQPSDGCGRRRRARTPRPTGSPTTLRSARGSVPRHAARAAEGAPPLVAERVDDTLRLCQHALRPAARGSGPGVGSGSRDVLDQRGGHPDQPDAVGERVVELQRPARPGRRRGPRRRTAPTAAARDRSPAWRSARRSRAPSARRRRPARRASARGTCDRSADRPPSVAARSSTGSRPRAGAGGGSAAWRARSCPPADRGRARRSSHQTTVMVERSSGSFSMCHMSASLSLMRCSNRMASRHGRGCYRTRAKVRQSTAPPCRSARIRIDPGCDRHAIPARRERAPSPPQHVDQGAVRPGSRRVRREGQRLLVLPPALLQPGARAAGVVGRPRHHAGADGRRDLRPGGRLSSRITCTRAGAVATRSCTPRRCRSAVAYWFLWNPPAGLSHERCFAYFLVVAVLVRVFVAVNEIPSASLVPELTDKYDERTSILSYRFFFGWWGGLAMTVLAYAVFLQPDADASGRRAEPRRATARYGLVAVDHDVSRPSSSPRSAPTPTSRICKHPPEKRHAGLAGAFRELMRDAVEPLVPGAVRGEHLRRHGGRTHRRARHLHQHVLLGADVEPDIGSRPRLLRLGRCSRWRSRRGLSRRIGKKRAAIATSLAAILIGPLPVALRLLGVFPPNGSPTLLPLLFVVRDGHDRAPHHVRHPDLVDGRRHRRGQRGGRPAGDPRASSSRPTASCRRPCPGSASSRRACCSAPSASRADAKPGAGRSGRRAPARAGLRADDRRPLPDRARVPGDVQHQPGRPRGESPQARSGGRDGDHEAISALDLAISARIRANSLPSWSMVGYLEPP